MAKNGNKNEKGTLKKILDDFDSSSNPSYYCC